MKHGDADIETIEFLSVKNITQQTASTPKDWQMTIVP